MDPLSITAAIVAVVQISGAVVSLCYEYRTGAKDGAKEAIRITEELKSLQDVLERLLKLAELEVARGSSRLQTLQPLVEPGGVLRCCQDDLSALQHKLAPQTGMKMLMKRLKWPLIEREVKKAIENVARTRETISLALITDQTAISLAIKDAIDIVAISQKEFILDDIRRRIHQWLRPPDHSINNEYARKLSYSGTGSWLFQDPRYVAWKSGTASSLWLHGIPGSGKTVICSTVIEDIMSHCHKKALHALTFFYFDFNDSEKQQYGSVLRSIIAQLLMQYPETPQTLVNMYNQHRANEAAPDVMFLSALQKTINLFSECYIVLDALDEARPREDVLNLIRQMLSWKNPRLHLLVTSRREMDIESTLSPLVKSKIEMQKLLVNIDISLYIHKRLECDSRLKKWSPAIKADIIETLTQGADGMFRWAVCQLDMLAKCVKTPMLRNTLQSLPRTLDDTYSRILLGIDQEYVRDAISVLRWLAFSARPLQLEEVVEVLAIDWDVNNKPAFDLAFRLPDPLDLPTICSSLVTLEEGNLDNQDASTPQKRTLVRLAHSSVRDYLISDRIGTSPAAYYALNKALSHSFITECCLTYLLQFKGPVDVRSPRTFPLVQYAAQFWTHHFQKSGITAREELENMAFTLLTSDQVPYLNWCELYNPDKPWLDEWNDQYGRKGSPLYYMSLLGLSQLCKRLLAADADPNASGGLYCTPLVAASKNGHENVVELLLESKADPNTEYYEDTTPLIVAASGGYVKIVEGLLSRGARVNGNSRSGWLEETALSAAAGRGHEKIVQTLLDAGADPTRYSRKLSEGPPIVEAALNGHDTVVKQLLLSSPAYETQEALIAAASNGHENIVRLLIEAKTGLEPALSCAVRVGAHDMVSRLIQEGAMASKDTRIEKRRVESECRMGTPLESAIRGGHELIMQQLIAEGASYKPDMLSMAAEYGHTHIVRCLIQQYPHEPAVLSVSLCVAIQKGFKSIVELLLDNGADIEYADSWYARPLHVAVGYGNLDLLEFLLGRGADINSEGGIERIYQRGGALQSAANSGHLPIVRFLVQHGADLEMYGRSQRNALQYAASGGHILIIKELLAAGGNVNSRGKLGSVLYCAVNDNQPDTVRLLLESGADVNEVTETQEGNISPRPKPLLQASKNGNLRVVKILLDAGADPNVSSALWSNSELPLHAAAKVGCIDILQVLLEHGANVNAQAEDGFSAIHFAAYSGHHDALQFLLVDYHANPKVTLFNGSLALHTAASQGYPQCIEVCLDAGLDVSSQNNQGRTPLHWATENGHKAAVEKLLAKGVDVNVREAQTGMTALDYAKQKAYEQPKKKSWKKLVKLIETKI